MYNYVIRKDYPMIKTLMVKHVPICGDIEMEGCYWIDRSLFPVLPMRGEVYAVRYGELYRGSPLLAVKVERVSPC